MDPGVAAAMESPTDGSGCYGLAIKGNYFSIENKIKDNIIR